MAEQLGQLLNWTFLLSPGFLLPILGGLLPPLVWLYFWLKEDLHPEPQKRIIFTFLAGMLSVFFALWIEEMIYFLETSAGIIKTSAGIVILLALWAIVEELVKFIAAYYGGIKRAECDEPIDEPIYLITAALGFAAMENILFLTKTIEKANGVEFLPALLTGDLRFIGANLLHVVTSAFIGIALSVCFFHHHSKVRNFIGGFFIASVLHFLFNYLIIKEAGEMNVLQITKIMLPLWAIVVVIILILEKVKRLKNIKSQYQ